MGYLFGAGNADRIAVTGLIPWTTRMSVYARFSLAAVNTTPRKIWTTAGSIATVLDFVSGGTNQVRFGYQNAVSVSQFASWTSGFTAGAIHTLVGTIDLTLGSNNVKLYADVDATLKAALTSPLGPRLAETDYYMGGEGGTASLAGILYELAYWADHALTGPQAAKLGEEDGNVIGADVPMPTDYWPLGSNADARWSTRPEDKRILVVPYGGHHGTVTGASVVAHVGNNRLPWLRRHGL